MSHTSFFRDRHHRSLRRTWQSMCLDESGPTRIITYQIPHRSRYRPWEDFSFLGHDRLASPGAILCTCRHAMRS